MTVRQPRYSKEEFAQRGDALYESQIRSQVEEGNHGKIVAIDIETGDFEIADSIVTSSEHLINRVPDAQTWFIRIGHQAVYHFGARSLKKDVKIATAFGDIQHGSIPQSGRNASARLATRAGEKKL
jgi:hypothetical protein